MRLRATVKIRNDHIVAAREERGWSQKETAMHAGIPLFWLANFEALRFTGNIKIATRYATLLAATLGIKTNEVMPEGVWGVDIQTTRMAIQDVPADLLISSVNGGNRFILPAPDDAMELREQVAEYLGFIDNDRTRTIVAEYYGVDDIPAPYTLESLGRKHNLNRERVRQIIFQGLNDIRRKARTHA